MHHCYNFFVSPPPFRAPQPPPPNNFMVLNLFFSDPYPPHSNGIIQCRWPSLSKILRSCLMDTASTVRQSASTAIQRITTKSTELTLLALSTLCRFTDAVTGLSGKWGGGGVSVCLCRLIFECLSAPLITSYHDNLLICDRGYGMAWYGGCFYEL